MEKIALNLAQITNINNQVKGDNSRYFIQDENFYKIVVSNILKYIINREKLKNNFSLKYSRIIEQSLLTLEKYGVWAWEEVIKVFQLLYYDDVFIGYVTKYVDDFKPLDQIAIYDNGLVNQDQMIDLLKKSSIFAKKLHEQGISHCDYHKANILSNGIDIKTVDFDDSCIISKHKKVIYYESPYADISYINKNIINILTQDKEIDYNDKLRGDLPVEICDYLEFFEYNIDWLKKGLIRASMPNEYPHDFLDELRNYEYIENCFQKKLK